MYWRDLTHHPCLLSDMENCDWVYLSLQLIMHFFYPVLKPRDSSCKQYANLLIYHLAELAERQGLHTLHHKFQLRTIFIIGKVNGSKFLIDTNERLKRSAKGHSKNTQLVSDTEVQLNILNSNSTANWNFPPQQSIGFSSNKSLEFVFFTGYYIALVLLLSLWIDRFVCLSLN